MNSIGRIGRAALLALALAAGARAEGIAWMPVSYPALIADSDLIVVGKVLRTADTAHDDGWTACGQISVAETLRGTLPQGGVQIDFPSRRPAAYDGEEVPAAPAEVIFEEGQEGIWFLKRHADGTHFTASHPSRFKPLPFLARVKSEIAKAK